METKFTKGEWKYTIKNFPDLPLTLCLNYAITNPVDYREIKEKMIAQIDFQKNNNPILEEIEANAQLISAAPDMFYALFDLYNDKEVWSNLFESQQESICRILNKATGSSFFQH